VIVALGLFALIALAGFTLLRSILDAQARTEARLARLSEIQRALFVVAGDLDQVSGRIEGGPDAIVFQKTDASGRPFVISYAVSGSTLTRTVAGAGGGGGGAVTVFFTYAPALSLASQREAEEVIAPVLARVLAREARRV
jgi:general secretion pathway protein J